jgi:histidinol phosphatase-like enzyme
VARGLITREQVAAVHARFVEVFAAASGVRLPCYYCLHGPDDGCHCRKPSPGLLWQAAVDQKLFGEPGVIVGDKPADVEAGAALGYPGVLFGPNPDVAPEASWEFAVARDWREARTHAERLLARQIGVVE